MTTARDPASSERLLRWLNTLSDLVRLRLLRLLEAEELSVGEMAGILQLPQSTVSRHLKLLFESDWVAKRTEGTASLYRMDVQSLGPTARQLWSVARGQLGGEPVLEEDDRRMSHVIGQRTTDSKAFFGRIGSEWDRLRNELFGTTFTTAALLSLLDTTWVVADLGCGTGTTAEYLAHVVRKVIAVDREPAMLEAARKRLAAFDNVEFRQDELTALSIDDDAVDAAVALLVMVCLPQPSEALGEIARVLRPGGVAMIIDMVAHGRESYSHTMGHCHLGFDEEAVMAWVQGSALTDLTYRKLRPDTSAKGPALFVATMKKR